MGVTDRLVLSDEQWDRISCLIIGRPDQRGSTGRDNRMKLNLSSTRLRNPDGSWRTV